MSAAGQEAAQPTPAESDKPGSIAHWVAEIDLYDRETSRWYDRCKRIWRRYKDERSPREENIARYNVLWANTQTLLPNLYARNPKPDIQRRFKDADPVGRVTSDVLERSVTYFTDTDIFAAVMRQGVVDYLLPGRGQAWVRYVPHMKQMPFEISNDAEQDDDEPNTQEVLDYEEVCVDYINLEDFGHNICRTWQEVYCVWRKVYLTREELVERFGEKGKAVPLDYVAKTLSDAKLDDGVSKATIYELWDKSKKCAVWFHKTIPEALDIRDDPLRLDDFFPCPKPMLVNLINDSLIPTPLYAEYQDQAQELDNLTGRITAMTKSLKVAGVYDASAQGIDRLLAEGVDNRLIPVESFSVFAEKGGLDGAMQLLPMLDIAKTLQIMYEVREQVKTDLHEISGIPDIVRGASDPNETLGAQQIKTAFATNRISDAQRDVQRFVREVIRIMVDVMCNHFSLDTIKKISGVSLLTQQQKAMAQQYLQQAQASGQPPQLPAGIDMDKAQQLMNDPTWEEVDALIRDNALRCFRIDIETDSTIKADEEAEKQSRIEFLKAMGGFLQSAQAAGEAQPEMVPVLGQMVMFGMRAFPIGKEMEGTIQAAINKLEKNAQNPQPKQDPEMAKVQAQAQADQQKMQSEAQLKAQELQMNAQIEQHKAQLQAQTDQAKAQAQAAVDQHLNEVENQRRMAELAQEERLATIKIQAETDMRLKVAHIQAAASIEVARINAKADDGAEAEAREVSGE